MKNWRQCSIAVLCVVCSLPTLCSAQDSVTILSGPELKKVVPPGFYFQAQSAPTQMRNAAAARFGNDRYVIAGLVDTSGYAADVRAKYEGFFITDSPVIINGSDLGTGAYGFGFSNDGKLNILDVAGNEILSVSITKDTALRRPRPLMLTLSGGVLRFYRGRDYAAISFK